MVEGVVKKNIEEMMDERGKKGEKKNVDEGGK